MRCSKNEGAYQCQRDTDEGHKQCLQCRLMVKRSKAKAKPDRPVPADMLVGIPYEPRNLPKRPPGGRP